MRVMFENTDDWVKEKIRGISHRSRVTFTAAAAAGIFAHMYTLTNKLPNYDELTFGAGGVGVTVSSGRWGLEALHQLSILLVGESYSLPWFSGMIAIVFMALAACYVVKFLDIRQDILCVLTGSVLVVYPAFTCAMFFMFTARYYAFAVFLMAWGLYQFDRQLSVASQRKREGVSGYRQSLFFAWLAGIGCVMLATSVFQAYYPLAAGLCVVKLIQMCLGGEAGEYGKVFRKAWIYLAMLVAAVALYILSAKAVAALAGDPLSGYRGMNQLGTIRAAQIPWMVKEIYKSVILLFTSDFYQVNPTAFLRVALAVCCLFTAVLSAACMWPKCREKGGVLLTAELAVFVLILPFCLNGIIIMQPDSWFYTLMEYGTVTIFLCPLAVLDTVLSEGRLNDACPAKLRKAADIVITFSILCCVGIYIWFDNGNYVTMDYAYRSAESYFTSMLTQVRMTEGYTDEMPVYVLGWDSEIADKSFASNGSLDVFNMAGKNDSLVHAWNWYAFLENYLNYRQFDWNEEKIEELCSSPEAGAMPCYPNQGSIARMGDGIVIKIAEKE